MNDKKIVEQCVLPAELSNLAKVQAFVKREALKYGFPPVMEGKLHMLVEELLVNMWSGATSRPLFLLFPTK